MEYTDEEIINNAIADLEFAIQFVKEHGEINENCLTEDEAKIEDMQNSIDRLYDLLEKNLKKR